jgi:hypothetical protein
MTRSGIEPGACRVFSFFIPGAGAHHRYESVSPLSRHWLSYVPVAGKWTFSGQKSERKKWARLLVHFASKHYSSLQVERKRLTLPWTMTRPGFEPSSCSSANWTITESRYGPPPWVYLFLWSAAEYLSYNPPAWRQAPKKEMKLSRRMTRAGVEPVSCLKTSKEHPTDAGVDHHHESLSSYPTSRCFSRDPRTQINKMMFWEASSPNPDSSRSLPACRFLIFVSHKR